MNESDLQGAIIDAARLFSWRTAHFRPALTKHGWRTPVQGDGKGFPDILLIRDRRLLVVELKAGRNKLSAEQEAWLEAFRGVPGVEVHVWREGDWPDEVLRVLSGKPIKEAA